MIRQLFNLKIMGLFLLGTGLFAQVSNRPNDTVIREALTQSQTEKDLNISDLSYELTDFYASKKSTIQHIYLRQSLNGLEIIGTESSIHLSPNGKISSVKNNFTNSIEKRGNNITASPQISAIQAVNSAAAHLGYSISKPLNIVSQDFGVNQKTVINNGGISLSDIIAQLRYLLIEDGNIVLVWEFAIEATDKGEWYNLRVNAHNGQVVNKVSWMSSCNFEHSHDDNQEGTTWHYHDQPYTKEQAQNNNNKSLLLTGTYNVFERPLESPFSGSRTMALADDIVDLTASPYGWHDTDGVDGNEYTVTRGNNVNAYEDGDNVGFQPDGGASLTFDYPFNQTYSSSNQYESAAITNLFYWNNIIHDILYQYGFDEVSGNFQQNNYGKGGLGNDFVKAEAQDNSGTCNANFGTPPDGHIPTMQMYICDNRDGDFDNGVIIHEYGHGVSNRLTGGPSIANCLTNLEQMGEGWSDYFSLMITMKPGDQGADPKTIGNYLFGHGPTDGGIRPYPYSTDMSINPHTYDSIRSVMFPHGVGSVWCAMLWDMTWALIDEYGYDADIYNGTGGNNIAMNLVMEGLKLQTCNPGFVDGRDAILEADQLLYNGANQCLIWEAFAKRGLGLSANQGSSSYLNDGEEAFDAPSSPTEFTAPDYAVCTDVPVITGLRGGLPHGGVYSGLGVTDDGNGSTYSFDPEVAGVGIHTITYSVPANNCAPAGSNTDEIEVLPGLIIACPEDIEINVSGGDCSAVVTFTAPEGSTSCNMSSEENFDNVSAPGLPTGWTTSTEEGTANNWVTVTDQSSSTPNSVFAANPSTVSLSSLISPDFQINSQYSKLLFDIYYRTGFAFDGVVLEYSTDSGSTWKDILDGGGVFATGAYNDDINSGWDNPLSGRDAWTGNSGGFVNVEIRLNTSFNGQNIRFRWRIATDSSFSSTGVWVDNIVVEGVFATDPTTTQVEGLPSGSDFPVGTTTNTFEVTDANGNTTTCSFDVIVDDGVAPEINCPDDMIVEIPVGATYTLPDYWTDGGVTANDACSGISGEIQSPAIGTELPAGVHTIEFMVQDAAGNASQCSFDLTIEETMAVSDAEFADLITIYPNPTDNLVKISNQTNEVIKKIMLTDLSGKQVQEFNINNGKNENTISVRHLPSGTYILSIVSDRNTVIKKLIKK